MKKMKTHKEKSMTSSEYKRKVADAIKRHLRVVFVDIRKHKWYCPNCRKWWKTFFGLPENSWYKVMPKHLQKNHVCWKCYCKFRKEKGFAPIKYKLVSLTRDNITAFKITNNTITFCKNIKKPTTKFRDKFEKIKK